MNKPANHLPDNFVPDRYCRVSVQPYHGLMIEDAIVAHLLGRDSYRRTRYVILENDGHCAVVAVKRSSEEPLFSPINEVALIALPDSCIFLEDEQLDVGNPTALGGKARTLGLNSRSTLVARGMYGHVNFIYHPDPIKVRVVDVIPPEPSKLLDMAEQVLGYVDLPAVELVPQFIDMRERAALAPQAEAYLIACRASGLSFDTPTYYLDERPDRRNWTMVACERSREIHEHFYGEDAPRVETCPRKLVEDVGELTLVRCCMREAQIEIYQNCAIVPWGATLAQVEEGLRILVSEIGRRHEDESLAQPVAED